MRFHRELSISEKYRMQLGVLLLVQRPGEDWSLREIPLVFLCRVGLRARIVWYGHRRILRAE